MTEKPAALRKKKTAPKPDNTAGEAPRSDAALKKAILKEALKDAAFDGFNDSVLAKAGKNVELCLVGDGPLRTVIEMAIAQNNAEQYIKLLGWKSSKDVLQIIESSRGFVLPSFAEGLPVSLMEAMALARPVVGTNVGAVSELVENGRHGWLVPAGSVESLTAAIGEMLDAPVEVLTKMGSEGSKRVIERHNARLGAQRLASLFMGSV